MHNIISIPGPDRVVSGQHPAGFGYHETIGKRSEQEDSITWNLLDASILPPDFVQKQLQPEAMGHRLWSALLAMNKQIKTLDGCTISSTLYDGRGNFINATLGDALSFVAVYDKQGKIRQVIRLNEVIHHPDLPEEKARIIEAGSFVYAGRLMGSLAISRSLGDHWYKGISAEASIAHLSVDEIARLCKTEKSLIGKLQVIACCDGYTEPVDGRMRQDQALDNALIKKGHEDYLMEHLKSLDNLATMSESELAKHLVAKADEDGSRDNISIAIQTMSPDFPNPFAVSVQDGHGGCYMSMKVATLLREYVGAFADLSEEDYRKNSFSVYNNREAWERDNKPLPDEAPSSSVTASSNALAATFFKPDALSAKERFELGDLKRRIGTLTNNFLFSVSSLALIKALKNGKSYSSAVASVPPLVLKQLETLDQHGVLASLKEKETGAGFFSHPG